MTNFKNISEVLEKYRKKTLSQAVKKNLKLFRNHSKKWWKNWPRGSKVFLWQTVQKLAIFNKNEEKNSLASGKKIGEFNEKSLSQVVEKLTFNAII